MPPASSQPLEAPQRRRRLRTSLLVALGLLLALRMALPTALAAGLSSLAKPWGVGVVAADIDLSLLAGDIVAEDLRISRIPLDPAAGGDEEVLVTVERVELGLEWTALLARRIELDRVALRGARLRVVETTDGALRLPSAPPNESVEGSDPAEPWDVHVGQVELIDTVLALYSESRGDDVARFGASTLALSGFASDAGGLSVGAVALDGPTLDIDRDWVLARTTASANAADESADPAEDGAVPTREPEPASSGDAPRSVHADRITIETGNFQVRTPRGPVEIGVLLEVHGFDTASDRHFSVDLQLARNPGTVRITGRVGLSPLEFAGRVEWSEIPAPSILLIGRPELAGWLQSCVTEGNLSIALGSQGTGARGLTVKGSLSVDALVFADPDRGELSLVAEAVDVSVNEIFVPLGGNSPTRAIFESIEITAPEVHATRPSDAADRLRNALSSGDPDSARAEASDESSGGRTAPRAVVRIETFTLRDGAAKLRDESVSPPTEIGLHDIRIEASGAEPAAAAFETLDIAAIAQDASTLSLRGAAPGGSGALTFELRQLELPPFDPFARRAGWQLQSGRVSLHSELQLIDSEQIAARNRLRLEQLEIGSDDPNAVKKQLGVPLDLALALLRDPAGDIELAFPLSVQRGTVGTNFSAVVARAIQRALTGALASPLKLAGGATRLGNRGDDSDTTPFDPIAIAPGGDALPPDAAQQIQLLAALLSERPGLAISLQGVTAPSDRPTLALAELTERAVARSAFPEVEGIGFLTRRRIASALRNRARGSEGALAADDEAALARYLEATPVTEERAAALGRARSEAAHQRLVDAGAPSAGLTLAEPVRGEEPSIALLPRVRPHPDSESAT